MKVVIINGTGGCGKDTFVNLCKMIDPKIQNYSTIDAVKDVARKMGWLEDKSEKGRKFLSDIKELWDEYNYGATGVVIKRVSKYKDLLEELGMDTTVFVHCREPHKIKEMKEKFVELGCQVITLLIENNNVADILTNDSDRYVREYDYDLIVENNGTIDDLSSSARWFYYTWLVD